GFILSGISLGSLLFGFEMSSHEGEVAFSIFLIAIGLLFGISYLRHARKHPSPIWKSSGRRKGCAPCVMRVSEPEMTDV
ncbi:hypothetical protein ACC754_43935, partial [Rhizobium johnstonii]